MLTKKQRDLLVLIHERMQAGDVAPSFDEMRDALGLKSKSGIHRLITGLVERGYLARLPHRARALEVTRLPEGYRPGPSQPAASATLTKPGKPPPATYPVRTAFEPIPLYGRIAAGTPIEAIRDDGRHVEVPPALLGPGEHYALTVSGDSMIEAGINDGDTVVIRRCDSAENGTIVVALVDGEEVTLKRLQRKGGKILLIPENPRHEVRELEDSRVKVQGRLVSLMRTYH